MNDTWTIGFVGAGVMAETMIAGLRDNGFAPGRITASHRREDRCAELRAHGITACVDNREAARADVVVLSVKPQTLAGVLAELRGTIRPEALVLSIVAGARVRAIAEALGHARVVRAMPNLPCRIRQGMSVWHGRELLAADRSRVQTVLTSMGAEIEVDDEAHVDRATAVSGTGPAIVAHFVKAFLEAAAYIGEPRGVARETVLATLSGTVELLRQSDAHVAELIDEVTSPGGTTSRALQVLKNGRFSAVLTESVDAAYQRTVELGDQLEQKLKTP
ncbi:MAG: pyrroline-5-carboxylate reductase [Deltaproteobacteria bacterium]|nr:pyrroline-5-carboxylate reductase [Deltaproteobacteria bacterium]